MFKEGVQALCELFRKRGGWGGLGGWVGGLAHDPPSYIPGGGGLRVPLGTLILQCALRRAIQVIVVEQGSVPFVNRTFERGGFIAHLCLFGVLCPAVVPL